MGLSPISYLLSSISLFFPDDVHNGAVLDLDVLALEDVVRLADADLLVAHLGGHDRAGGSLRGGGEVQRHMLGVLHPLPVGAQHVIRCLLHVHDLAAHQLAGGHQRRGQMGLAVLVQLRGDALGLDGVGDLRHGGLDALAAAPLHQLPAREGQHRQNQNDGDDIDDVESSCALCFLFHVSS